MREVKAKLDSLGQGLITSIITAPVRRSVGVPPVTYRAWPEAVFKSYLFRYHYQGQSESDCSSRLRVREFLAVEPFWYGKSF